MDCTHARVQKVVDKVPVKITDGNTIYRSITKFIQVPCGMCINCRVAKTREWGVRLQMEASQWKKSCFVTLTYDDDHIHRTPCGHLTLYPPDFVKFKDSLRSYLYRQNPDQSPPLLRYFMCGEMGDHTKRPHYHAILFGLGVEDTDLIQQYWPHGFVSVKAFTVQAAEYVAGYIDKKIYRDPRHYWDEYGCCVWPYKNQSNGLASGYLEKNSDKLQLRPPRVGGVQYSYPRYFLKKDPLVKARADSIGEEKRKEQLLMEQESIEKGYDLYDSMQQREANLRARINLRKRDF